jgi:hypothetical protein
MSVVKTLYKIKNGKTSMRKSRPILLQTTFSKALEKLCTVGCHHPHNNNILVSEISGFNRGISTKDVAAK